MEKDKRLIRKQTLMDLLEPPEELPIPDRYLPPGKRNAHGEYCGQLLTSPVSGGKRLQACSLVFDSGESVIISYRPVPAYFQYERKQVAIKGTMRNPARDHPERQAVMGWHLDVEAIRLMDGEVPHSPPPTSLPPPPRIDRLSALASCTERHARIVGTLLSGELDGMWSAKIRLQLLDGELVIPDVRLTNPASAMLRDLLTSRKPPAPMLSIQSLSPVSRSGVSRSGVSRSGIASKGTDRSSTAPKIEMGGLITVIAALGEHAPQGLSICPGDVVYCGCGL